MTEAGVNLRYLAHPVNTLGPGQRLALWVAGCSLGCRGCITPELQDPAAGRRVRVARLLQRVLALADGLEGITLTGGEPFEQAEALADLLDAMAAALPDWNVLAFSGYPLARIEAMGSGPGRLLARSDVLVAGPYSVRHPPSHPLAGSGNQRVHYLSARGRALRQSCEALPMDAAELASGPNGALLVGVLSPAARARIHRRLGLEPAAHG